MMRFMELNKINVQYVPEVWVKMRLGGATNKSFKNMILQNLEILDSLKKMAYLQILLFFLLTNL